MRIAWALVSVAVVAGASFWALRRPVPEDTGDFESELACARAVLAAARLEPGDGPGPAACPPAGRRVYLTLHRPGADPRTAEVPGGAGPLSDRVSEVSRRLGDGPGRWGRDTTLQADVEIPPPFTGTAAGPGGIGLDPGLDGGVTAEGEVRVPGWAVARGMDRSELADWFRAEGATPLRTVAAIEVPDGPPRRLYRGALWPEAPLDAARVVQASRWGGDYLVAHVRPDGRYDYEYDALEGEARPGYNVLRHAGTTYSLYQLHRAVGDPRHLEGADRALGWLLKQFRTDKAHPEREFVVEGRRIKLGGAGLTLLALSERLAGSPDDRPELLERARSLARHIVSQQRGDGRFASYYAPAGSRYQASRRDSIYYPGEAILGLARFASVDPDPGAPWLDVAVRGADYLVRERWRALGVEVRVPHDAWLLQALEVIDRVRPDGARRDYAFAIGHRMARFQLHGPGIPLPYQGAPAFPGAPGLIPTGSRGEALGAAAALERRHRPGETFFLDAARANAGYGIRYQFQPGRLFAVADPAAALGGVPNSPLDPGVRIDGVQHNLSGWIFLAALLRGEAIP